MATKKAYEFRVIGEGAFPFDMLRHGMCYPADSHDANQLTATCQREVRLRSHYCAPDSNRWNSMGWRISEMRRFNS